MRAAGANRTPITGLRNQCNCHYTTAAYYLSIDGYRNPISSVTTTLEGFFPPVEVVVTRDYFHARISSVIHVSVITRTRCVCVCRFSERNRCCDHRSDHDPQRYKDGTKNTYKLFQFSQLSFVTYIKRAPGEDRTRVS